MSTDGLHTGGDVARLLGISRQRLSQLRDHGEFPRPIGKMGSAYVWRWADVQEWLDTRRGDRPEVRADLERRARQLERLGFSVSVTRDEAQTYVEGGFPEPGSGLWAGYISMRGNLSVHSEGVYEDPNAALDDVLSRFEKIVDRQFTSRDLEARIWELRRRGWDQPHDGGRLLDTMGEWHFYELRPPDGGKPITAKAESLLEARQQVVERAEAGQAEIDGEDS